MPARQSTAFPVTCSAAHDRRGLLGVLRWVIGGGKPHHLCPAPHLSLYIALCDNGPPTSGRLSVPDQDAVKRSDWPLDQLVEIKLTIQTGKAERNEPATTPENKPRSMSGTRRSGQLAAATKPRCVLDNYVLRHWLSNKRVVSISNMESIFRDDGRLQIARVATHSC